MQGDIGKTKAPYIKKFVILSIYKLVRSDIISQTVMGPASP